MKDKLLSALVIVTLAQSAIAYDCNSDCGKEAEFQYPCPIITNPGRTCTGRDPVKYSVCESAKEISCVFWEEVKDAVAHQFKEALRGEFNREVWAAVDGPEEEAEYMAKCQAAGIAVCAAIGAEIGGVYGAAAGGAAGVFVSYQLCKQSRRW